MDSLTFRRILVIVAIAVAVIFLVKMIGALDTILPDKILIVSAETVSIYTQPNANSLSLVELQKGDKLEHLDESNGDWLKVGHGQFTGFVKADHVEKSARYKE
ncbi:SH3 domain-containing protein [candidate division KSB1 bacterium]